MDPWNICQLFSASANLFCKWLLFGILDNSSRKKQDIGNLAMYLLGAQAVCGGTTHSHNSLAGPPHVGHQPGQTRWQSNYSILLLVCPCGCVDQTNPTSVEWVSGLLGFSISSTANFRRSLANLLWASVVILEDRDCFRKVEIWDCYWLQNVILALLCIDVFPNDNKLFQRRRCCPTPSHCLHLKLLLLFAAFSRAFSTSS